MVGWQERYLAQRYDDFDHVVYPGQYYTDHGQYLENVGWGRRFWLGVLARAMLMKMSDMKTRINVRTNNRRGACVSTPGKKTKERVEHFPHALAWTIFWIVTLSIG